MIISELLSINIDTSFVPGFDTPEVIVTIAAGLTAFMVYQALKYKNKYKNKLRTVYIFVQPEPEDNRECP